jgi:hypothetical protein
MFAETSNTVNNRWDLSPKAENILVQK